jgi:DUF4097 and DUF4098 domain-containing protein YvlB
MAITRPHSGSFFSGLLLIFVGILLLLHNYQGYDLGEALKHWWPLIFIVWGAIKLFERTVATRAGQPSGGTITASEVLLVFGLIVLVGIVVAVDYGKQHIGDRGIDLGETFSYDIEATPKPVSPDSHVTIHNGRGNISVRSSDTAEIRVLGKKNVKAWSDSDAQRVANPISIEIAQTGDGYEIHPTGLPSRDSRISVDLEVSVPPKAVVTVRNDKGDITISDMAAPVTINSGTGDIEVRDTTGDVSIDLRKGDVKVSDTKGNVKLSGHGGQIDVISASGSFTLDGEFYGPIRAEKVAKGVRFVSQRTDLTLSQLTGHMQASPGSLEVADVPGNLTVRAQDDISIENVTGKLKVDNHKGDVEVRYSTPPKEEVEIDNSSASISITLPESSSFEITGDCHNCDIESEFESDSLKTSQPHSGDSHIEGTYGSGHGPRITLKTSHGNISIHKTS